MKNGADLDKWCPPQSIVLRREGPVMAPAAAAEQPGISTEKTGNDVNLNG
ncbi:MAG: hypothetical protein IT258_17395 [Saprospiraceae bacterium]|nr:hypothetical protein [Saprospiraceae bacterium]